MHFQRTWRCLLLTGVTELCFGVALVPPAQYGESPAGGLAVSTDSRLRRGFVQAPAACCGLVLVGKLPWGQTLNPVPVPKELKAINPEKGKTR